VADRETTTPSQELFDVVRQIDWSDRLIGSKEAADGDEDAAANTLGAVEDTFAEPKLQVWTALQEAGRIVEFIKLTSAPDPMVSMHQIMQPNMTEAEKFGEKLEATVRKKEDLGRVADLLEAGAKALVGHAKQGKGYQEHLNHVRKEFLIESNRPEEFIIDCSHRSAGSRRPVDCKIKGQYRSDGDISIGGHIGVEPCLKYLRGQARSNFAKELFQQLSQEGLVYAGKGARYFVLQSSEKKIKLECGHAGTVTLELVKGAGEACEEVHVVVEETGERDLVIEVAMQASSRATMAN